MSKDKKTTLMQELVKLAVFAICVMFFVNCIIMLNIVPSASMQPTIKVGDITVSNCLSYLKDDPERGDVVIFKGEDGKTMVKRIIGLPNDVISFVDGYVVINGMVVEEEYIDDEIETNCGDTFVVPADCYFVMGDNRENSLDSRFFNQPYISKSDIKAKLMFVIPTSDIIKNVNN